MTQLVEIPPLLRALLEQQYGEQAADILSGYVRRPVTLRVNPLKADGTAVRDALTGAGIRWEPVPWYPDALILPDAREEAVRSLPLYAEGQVYLQSLSAMVPALALQPQPGQNLLDMCAAPGGKTTQLAALSGGQAMITACERDGIRAERLRHNLALQGAGRVSVMQTDARQLDDFFSFDGILLDAPCSGSGTLTPGEPPRRMTAEWLRKLNRTQAALLRKALTLLRPGQTLVYATCSVLRCENEDILREALPQAEIVPLTAWQEALPLLPTDLPGTLCVRPTALYEGFFIAKLRKKGKSA